MNIIVNEKSKKKIILIASLFFLLNLFPSILNAKIKILSPASQALTKYEIMVLIGESSGTDSVEVEINAKEKHKLKVANNTFHDRINLKSGENKIKVIAFSQGTSVDSVDLKIYYTKDMRSSNNPKDFSPFYFHTMLIEDGDCMECHDSRLSTDKLELKKGERGLCFNCHDERLDVKFVHGPVAGGACLSCHNPHGSPNEYTVRITGEKLCYFCHEEDRLKKEHLSKLKPEEAKKTCYDCHEVHGGNKQYFLKY